MEILESVAVTSARNPSGAFDELDIVPGGRTGRRFRRMFVYLNTQARMLGKSHRFSGAMGY
jgi:hypothetical protein